jgi:hypothetical protein
LFAPKDRKWQVSIKINLFYFWATMVLHTVKEPSNDPEFKVYNQVAADSRRYKMVDKKKK